MIGRLTALKRLLRLPISPPPYVEVSLEEEILMKEQAHSNLIGGSGPLREA